MVMVQQKQDSPWGDSCQYFYSCRTREGQLGTSPRALEQITQCLPGNGKFQLWVCSASLLSAQRGVAARLLCRTALDLADLRNTEFL